MRSIEKEDLVGKTIKKIDARADNVLKLFFTDGSELAIWAEVGSLHLPFLYVEEDSE